VSWTVTYYSLESPQKEVTSHSMATKDNALHLAIERRRDKCKVVRINGPAGVLDGPALDEALQRFAARM
jgi:hypothetical protein